MYVYLPCRQLISPSNAVKWLDLVHLGYSEIHYAFMTGLAGSTRSHGDNNSLATGAVLDARIYGVNDQ